MEAPGPGGGVDTEEPGATAQSQGEGGKLRGAISKNVTLFSTVYIASPWCVRGSRRAWVGGGGGRRVRDDMSQRRGRGGGGRQEEGVFTVTQGVFAVPELTDIMFDLQLLISETSFSFGASSTPVL